MKIFNNKKEMKQMASSVEKTLKKPFLQIRAEALRKMVRLDRDAVAYVAHRGLSANAPENTVRAFKMAAARRFDAMETDIRRTRDHKLVLMHDASLKRMCGVDVNVGDLTYEELQKIPVTGGNGSDRVKRAADARRVPLLKEYLVICRDSGMVPMMELKDNWDVTEPIDEDYLRDIGDQVEEVMENRPVIFVSFNLQSLVNLKNLLENEKKVHASFYHLVKATKDLDLTWYQRHEVGLSIQGKANKLSHIKRLKKAGIPLVVWTVDDPDQARLYIRAGVDWLASNRKLWRA